MQGATTLDTLTPQLKDAITTVGAAVKGLPELHAYREATSRMEADADTMNLIGHLQRLQAELRVKQANGALSRDDIARLRHLQQSVQAQPAFVALMAAQRAAQACLPPINDEIGRLLGIDFAALAAPASCCS